MLSAHSIRTTSLYAAAAPLPNPSAYPSYYSDHSNTNTTNNITGSALHHYPLDVILENDTENNDDDDNGDSSDERNDCNSECRPAAAAAAHSFYGDASLYYGAFRTDVPVLPPHRSQSHSSSWLASPMTQPWDTCNNNNNSNLSMSVPDSLDATDYENETDDDSCDEVDRCKSTGCSADPHRHTNDDCIADYRYYNNNRNDDDYDDGMADLDAVAAKHSVWRSPTSIFDDDPFATNGVPCSDSSGGSSSSCSSINESCSPEYSSLDSCRLNNSVSLFFWGNANTTNHITGATSSSTGSTNVPVASTDSLPLQHLHMDVETPTPPRLRSPWFGYSNGLSVILEEERDSDDEYNDDTDDDENVTNASVESVGTKVYETQMIPVEEPNRATRSTYNVAAASSTTRSEALPPIHTQRKKDDNVDDERRCFWCALFFPPQERIFVEIPWEG